MAKKFVISLFSLLFATCLFATAKPMTQRELGIIPNITDHYKALPLLYHFTEMPKEKVNDYISRQYIYSSESEIVRWYLKKGADIPTHNHVNEQIVWIVKGKVAVYSQGKKFIVNAGDVLVIPPNVPHHFIALEDTIDVDFFTPARQDWVDRTANYLKK